MTFYDSKYPDVSGHFVLVHQEQLSDELYQAVEDTAPTPRQPVARKQWLLLLNHPQTFVGKLPLSWRDLTRYLSGIPGNVWVGMQLATVEDCEKVRHLRKLRSRRRFLVLDMYTPEMAMVLEPHLLAWRCMHCGTRGEGPKPENCPSGSVCLGEEWRIKPQIHWVVGRGDFSKYGIPKERPE